MNGNDEKTVSFKDISVNFLTTVFVSAISSFAIFFLSLCALFGYAFHNQTIELETLNEVSQKLTNISINAETAALKAQDAAIKAQQAANEAATAARIAEQNSELLKNK
jgi:hypothetical protein